MQVTADRIRRVAEKHVELQVPCTYASAKYTEGYGYTKEAVEGYHKAHQEGQCPCAGTGWTPLPVSLWADALRCAKKFMFHIFLLRAVTVQVYEWSEAIFGGRSLGQATADNTDDALVLALESRQGVLRC